MKKEEGDQANVSSPSIKINTEGKSSVFLRVLPDQGKISRYPDITETMINDLINPTPFGAKSPNKSCEQTPDMVLKEALGNRSSRKRKMFPKRSNKQTQTIHESSQISSCRGCRSFIPISGDFYFKISCFIRNFIELLLALYYFIIYLTIWSKCEIIGFSFVGHILRSNESKNISRCSGSQPCHTWREVSQSANKFGISESSQYVNKKDSGDVTEEKDATRNITEFAKVEYDDFVTVKTEENVTNTQQQILDGCEDEFTVPKETNTEEKKIDNYEALSKIIFIETTNTELKEIDIVEDNFESGEIDTRKNDTEQKERKSEYIMFAEHLDKNVRIKENIFYNNLDNPLVSFMHKTDLDRIYTKKELIAKLKKKVPDGRILQSDHSGEVRDGSDYMKVVRDLTCLPVSSTTDPVTETKVCMLLNVEKQSSTNNVIRRQDSHVESDGQTVASGTTATTLTQAGTSVVQPSTADPAISTKIDLNNLDDVLRETALGRDKGPKVTMKFELLRLCTLRNYPKENKPYISRLAKAGFYYAANGDEVVCFCCGVRRSSWTANCDPMSTHQRLSPKCPFLTRNEEVNIPVPEEDEDDYNKFTLLEDLLQNPPPILDSDTHRGHSINGISAASEDNGAAPLVAPAKTGQPKQKRRYNKTPKNPHYAVKDVRQNSFQGWPAGHIISPKLLAECGFYYAGLEDCVRCFHCGIGLRHWAVEDDPWIEHSRWTLENPCYFLIQMKGEEYVDLVRLAVEITDNQPPQADSEQPPVEQPNSKEESSQGTGQTVVTSASSSNRDSSAVQSNTSTTTAGSATHKGNKSEQKQLKMENERLRKQTYCTICAERNVCVVFLPCGHLVTCDHCAPTLSKCPTCRQVIKGTVKTYMS